MVTQSSTITLPIILVCCGKQDHAYFRRNPPPSLTYFNDSYTFSDTALIGMVVVGCSPQNILPIAYLGNIYIIIYESKIVKMQPQNSPFSAANAVERVLFIYLEKANNSKWSCS